MAEVINSFLVGIGYQYDGKGEKDVTSGLDGIKSKALQMGAVLGAGAAAAGFLATNFAESTDDLGKFAQFLDLSANNVNGLGLAVKENGGSLEGLKGQLIGLEKIRAEGLTGKFGFYENAALAGINAGAVTGAKNSLEAYLALGDQVRNMNSRQRQNAASVLGLDQASMLLLMKGTNGARELMERYQKISPITEEMTGKSAEYNDQLLLLTTNISGFSNKIANSFLGPMTEAVAGMNEWVDVNREFINTNIEDTIDGVSESMVGLASAGAVITGGGLLMGLASMSKSIPLIGAGLAAVAGAAGTLALLSGAAAAGYYTGGVIYDNLDNDSKNWIVDNIAQLEALFGDERALNYLRYNNPQYAAEVDGIHNVFSGEPLSRTNTRRVQPIIVNNIMDGKVFERKIMDVNERQNEQTFEELKSPSDG